jgi:hypothetical protein
MMLLTHLPELVILFKIIGLVTLILIDFLCLCAEDGIWNEFSKGTTTVEIIFEVFPSYVKSYYANKFYEF